VSADCFADEGIWTGAGDADGNVPARQLFGVASGEVQGAVVGGAAHPLAERLVAALDVDFIDVANQIGVVADLDRALFHYRQSIRFEEAQENLYGAAQTRFNVAAVLLKADGVVVVGADVIECFALAAYVEENAYRQYMAMQIGTPYVFSDAEQKASREKLWTPSLFKKTWDHYRSKLP